MTKAYVYVQKVTGAKFLFKYDITFQVHIMNYAQKKKRKKVHTMNSSSRLMGRRIDIYIER